MRGNRKKVACASCDRQEALPMQTVSRITLPIDPAGEGKISHLRCRVSQPQELAITSEL
jgi:hypothetical protein